MAEDGRTTEHLGAFHLTSFVLISSLSSSMTMTMTELFCGHPGVHRLLNTSGNKIAGWKGRCAESLNATVNLHIQYYL